MLDLISNAGNCGSPMHNTIIGVYIQYRRQLKLNQALLQDGLLEQIESFMDNMIKSVATYQKGRRSSAYDFFKDAMDVIESEIEELIKPVPHDMVLYRGRIGNVERSPMEMNHISLKRRYLVKTERYSFPGLPCIYLGDSVKVCLDELGAERNETQIARFRTRNDKNIHLYLDLAAPFDYTLDTIMENAELRRTVLKILPLIFCVSVKFDYPYEDEQDRRVSFRSEYIVPQFLLQYIMEDERMDRVAGIKYRSVLHIRSGWDHKDEKGISVNNYVFPAITTADVDISPLIASLLQYDGKETNAL